MLWYVLHTYAAQEDRVKEAILKGVKDTPFESQIGEILVPKQKTYHIREGKKIEREKKIFNSYIIVQCELTTPLLTHIINIPGVTHFLGSGKTPTPLHQSEVDRLLGIEERGKTKVVEYEFLPNDKIRIVSGPFEDFEGIVDKISPDGEKLIAKVTVFGRVTPVEVNMDQVELI